jgi:hypothetical protein
MERRRLQPASARTLWLNMQATGVVRSAVVLLILVTLHACGDDKSPVRPTSTTTPTVATLVRLEIVGPRTLPPGEATRFAVTGHFSDGSTRDMSTQASWQSQNSSVLAVEGLGQATARQLGESVLTVRTAGLSSTTEVVVVPAGTFRLAVIAREAGSIFLDIRVEVLEGRGAGLSTTRLVNGRYALYGVAGDTLVRVSGRGYREHNQRLVVADHTAIEVEMVPDRPRAQISGDYTLTITADPARCGALPGEVRIRRYAAQVTQLGPEILVTLAGGDSTTGTLVRNQFGGRLDADNMRATFNLALNFNYYYRYYYSGFIPPPDVAERLSGTSYLLISGGGTTSVSDRSLSGTLRGPIQIVEMPVLWAVSRWGASCDSVHGFVLSR